MRYPIVLLILLLSIPSLAQKNPISFRDLDLNNGLLFQPNTMKPFSGTAQERFANGDKRLRVPIKAGKIHGTVEEWARNGKKVAQSHYVEGVQDGKEIQWYATGQKKLEVNYVNGQVEGICIEWFKNGAKKSEGLFVRGKEDGTHNWWYPDGAKDQVVEYKNGRADGVVRHWRQNGQLQLESHYQDGQQHGPTKEWHSNSQMILQGHYSAGKEDGEFRYWSKQGRLLGIQVYEQGRLIKDLNYRNGNVRTAEGFVQVFNEKESFFSVAVNGAEVIPQSSPEDIIYVIDGQFLQMFNTAVHRFSPESPKVISEEALLKKFVDYEVRYIEEQTEAKIDIQSEIGQTQSGKMPIDISFA
ncbi:MAG: toxin-antitoxin system YwqK family antitoxin, partial [Bacteroidota bacterium]